MRFCSVKPGKEFFTLVNSESETLLAPTVFCLCHDLTDARLTGNTLQYGGIQNINGSYQSKEKMVVLQKFLLFSVSLG